MLRRGFTLGLLRPLVPGSSAAISSASTPALAAQPSPVESPSEGKSHDDTFRASDLTYELSQQQTRPPQEEGVKFGSVFTPHMFLAEHSVEAGWAHPAIKPFGLIPMHPAAQVFHYGLCCFEGMKAYKGVDGRARLFRPEMNMARLRRSAQRLQLADFEPQELLVCIKELLRVDKAWLPSKEGYALYIRPFMFSSAHVLGIAKPSRTTASVVMSPVGPYFSSGLRPITLFLDEAHARAWPGGVGEFKVGGNYASSIHPQVQAASAFGAQQVLYTFNPTGQPQSEEAFVEECGSMNVFFLLQTGGGRELVTSPLEGGTILPGITRDSILQLARGWADLEVSERRLSIGELKQAAAGGRLLEVFGCGTACVVQPVETLLRANGDVLRTQYTAGDPRSVALRVHHQLQDIQYARVPHPWSVAID